MSEFAKANIRREVENLVSGGMPWEVVFCSLVGVAIEICEGRPRGIYALDAGAGTIREAADRLEKTEDAFGDRRRPMGFVW